MVKSALRFIGAIAALMVVHLVFFGVADSGEITQFWIAAATFAIIAAINDGREAKP